MIAALVLAVSLMATPRAVLDQCRATCEQAVTDRERADADLHLLDALLGEAWAHEMVVDGALLGVPDALRRQRAMEVLDEALVASARLDEVLQRMARDGHSISLAASRWRLRRGVTCAAAGLLAEGDARSRLLREARPLLGDVVAGRADASGRSRRMLAAVCLALEDAAGASAQLAPMSSDESMSPAERTAMDVLRWRGLSSADTLIAAQTSIDAAEDPWQVHLLGDAALAQSDSLHVASRAAAMWRRRLERSGRTLEQAAATVRHAAAVLPAFAGVPDDTTDAALLAGVADGLIASGRRKQARELLEVGTSAMRTGFDRALLLEAAAEAVAVQTGGVEAIVAWRDAAAAASGSHRRRLLDRAARQAVLGSDDRRDDALIEAVLVEAAADGDARDHWSLTLAHRAAQRGDVDAAMTRLGAINPGSDVHAGAMELMLHLLGQRLRSGDFDQEDAKRVDALRAAAMIAHRRGSPWAGEVAAVAAMLRIERSLLDGDIDHARTLRLKDEAMTLARQSDRSMIDAQMAAVAGDRAGLQRAMRGMEPPGRRGLLNWMSSHSPTMAGVVATTLSAQDLSGDAAQDLPLADALRQSGRTSEALVIYDSILSTSPNLVGAMLGRCDCLWQSTDRSDLARAAQGYRRIAAMPREDDPARWRLANERLLAVLARAGVDPAKLQARCARLQAIDPELRCDGEVAPRSAAARQLPPVGGAD